MRPPAKSGASIRAMWEGGPRRLWSPSKTTLTPMGYAEGGFVGSYVCGQCLATSSGVYRVREEQKWLCGPCKSKIQLPGKVPGTTNLMQRRERHLAQGGRR
jgi:hypothetical protein